MLFSILLFAQSCTACCATSRSIAEIELRLYLDPTDLNREAAVRELKLVDPTIDGSEWNCRGRIDSAQGALDRSRALSIRLPSARKECASLTESLTNVAEAACGPVSLHDLVVAGDPTVVKAIDRLPNGGAYDVWKTWLRLARDVPDRSTRLGKALEIGGGVAEIAIEESLGRHDPREWSPRDVALIVIKAREEDAKETAPGLVDRLDVDTPANRVTSYIRALSPMGANRALELVRANQRREPERKPAHGVIYAIHGLHFDEELQLYADEWEKAHPNEPPMLSMRGSDKQKRLQQLDLYLEKRWKETDDGAPHPDLDKIRAEIKKLETKEKSP